MQDDDDGFDESRPQNLVQRFAHFWVLVSRFFWTNRCPVRASALAYTTLLAMVPLLAVSVTVALAIFQGAAGRDKLKGWIQHIVVNVAPALEQATGSAPNATETDATVATPGNTANVPPGRKDAAQAQITIRQNQVVDNILESIGNIKVGTIGATAMAGLLFAAISLLRTIEQAFNDIWGITKGRSWFWSVVLYWAVMTLGPIILSIGLSAGYLKSIAQHTTWLDALPGIGIFKSAMLPLATLTLGFSLFYQLMPNTKVQFKAALVGGAVAALLWYGNNQLSVLYNTKVVMYSKIYGSLGAVPLFLVGLYFSWMIVLFGAQVTYVYQNRKAYLQEKQAQKVHQRGREFAALRMITEIARRFSLNQPPLAVSAMANQLGIPPRMAGQILQTLAQDRLLVEASGNEGAFLPARPLDQITMKDVIEALRTGQGRQVHTVDDPVRAVIKHEYTAIMDVETSRSRTVTLADLVRRAEEPY